MRISDWSSDVCSSDLRSIGLRHGSEMRHQFQPDDRTREYPYLPPSKNTPHLDLGRNPGLFNQNSGRLPQSVGKPGEERRMARSEERSVGKECVSTCRTWGSA